MEELGHRRGRLTYQARALRRDYESGMTPAMLTQKHELPSARVRELLKQSGARMRRRDAEPTDHGDRR